MGVNVLTLMLSAQASAQRVAPVGALPKALHVTVAQARDTTASWRPIAKGSAIGLTLGAIAGAIVTFREALNGMNCAGSTCSGGTHTIRNVSVGAAVGAAVGALVGVSAR